MITMEFNPVHFDWNFVFTIINLLVFYVLIKKFVWDKVMKTMDKRKELIEKDLSDAKNAKNEAENLKTQYETQLTQANIEARQIINKAQDDAKVEYDNIINRANNDARKLKDDAAVQAKADSEKALAQAKEDVANLAVKMAEKVIGSNVSSELDSDIYDEFLNEGSDK